MTIGTATGLDSRRVLVTGATGAVGPRIVDALAAGGYAIRTLSLDAPPTDAWPSGVDVCFGDVTDAVTVQRAMQGVDAVVHLAALLHMVNPPPELREKYERINVGGTTTVVEAAIRTGVKRVVLASTIAVYGPSNGRVLDEESVACPDTFYGQTKLAAEKIVLTARRADGQPLGTVLRFGAVYGSRLKGNYERLLRSLARGRFVPVGDGHNRRTLIYDKDLARAIVLAAAHPKAAGEVFNVTDGKFHTLSEIIAAMCVALDRTLPRFSFPAAPVRLAVGVLEDAARLAHRQSPIVRATIDKYAEDVAVSGTKMRTRLGFVSNYDLIEGWRDAVREMRDTGQL
ncbi:MAG: NAD-dependent epimerase/dehydratase family protein [Chloroflexi bacterium]|nr:NAD-dependent epimerase/dehydratase family protein [Chloroflexota bacterium]